MKPLSAPMELFARRHAEGASQSAAYREAYPRSVNWKPDSVHSKASTLAADVRVAARVAELRAAAVERTGVTQDQIIRELSRIAFFDIRKIFNRDGSLKNVLDLDDDTAAAIGSIEMLDIGTDGQLVMSKKFKTESKKAALELLGTHLGMFVKKFEDVTDPMTKALGNMPPAQAEEMIAALAQVRAIKEKSRSAS
ncbi:terminase small subunit [Acidovorax sp. A1169]|uniref:terminase small subunit n=1 Tax=Acidovorax sp. A1169 TaxID=3059524 RepID=UPI002737BB75|nr:terminase small subunit [Acidovorax sp. A1169]MDP4076233.1 terminase small subunit [Acidovorax sp. A1169]